MDRVDERNELERGSHRATMRRPYQLTGIGLLLLAGSISCEARQLLYYTPLGPGPGFFAWWLALILGGLAVGMILQATCAPPESRPPDFASTRIGRWRIAAVILALVATIVLLERVGYTLTMFVVCGCLLTALGRSGLLMTLLVALACSGGAYYIFHHWLAVPLPRGPLGF